MRRARSDFSLRLPCSLLYVLAFLLMYGGCDSGIYGDDRCRPSMVGGSVSGLVRHYRTTRINVLTADKDAKLAPPLGFDFDGTGTLRAAFNSKFLGSIGMTGDIGKDIANGTNRDGLTRLVALLLDVKTMDGEEGNCVEVQIAPSAPYPQGMVPPPEAQPLPAQRRAHVYQRIEKGALDSRASIVVEPTALRLPLYDETVTIPFYPVHVSGTVSDAGIKGGLLHGLVRRRDIEGPMSRAVARLATRLIRRHLVPGDPQYGQADSLRNIIESTERSEQKCMRSEDCCKSNPATCRILPEEFLESPLVSALLKAGYDLRAFQGESYTFQGPSMGTAEDMDSMSFALSFEAEKVEPATPSLCVPGTFCQDGTFASFAFGKGKFEGIGAVGGTGPEDVWLQAWIDNKTALFHYNGLTWEMNPAGYQPKNSASAGESDIWGDDLYSVWISDGLGGAVVRYDGTSALKTWTGPRENLGAIFGNGRSVLVAGATNLWRFDDMSTFIPTPEKNGPLPTPYKWMGLFVDRDCTEWAVGSRVDAMGQRMDNAGALWKRGAGEVWQQVLVNPIPNDPRAVRRLTGQDFFVAGLGAKVLVRHQEPDQTTVIPLMGGAVENLRRLWGSEEQGLWMIGQGIFRYDGKEAPSIKFTGVDGNSFNGLWGSSPDDVWVTGVDSGPMVLRYQPDGPPRGYQYNAPTGRLR